METLQPLLDILGLVWTEGLIRPMINGLILLNVVLFGNFGLTIIVFTVVVRLATFPLTRRQLEVSRKMAALQPQLQELQRRYGKNRQRLSEEQQKLYQRAGVNPLGCAGPMVVQMPIWFALYYALIYALPVSPESMVNLAQYLYPGLDMVHQALPLENHFLWFDLAIADPISLGTSPPLRGILLPVLVGGTMWVQQRMTPSMAPGGGQGFSQMMTYMMPFMFGYFTVFFPSGLALYWFTSNLIGIAMQYRSTGWGPLEDTVRRLPFLGSLWSRRLPPAPVELPPLEAAEESTREAKTTHSSSRRGRRRRAYGKRRGKRKERR